MKKKKKKKKKKKIRRRRKEKEDEKEEEDQKNYRQWKIIAQFVNSGSVSSCTWLLPR